VRATVAHRPHHRQIPCRCKVSRRPRATPRTAAWVSPSQPRSACEGSPFPCRSPEPVPALAYRPCARHWLIDPTESLAVAAESQPVDAGGHQASCRLDRSNYAGWALRTVSAIAESGDSPRRNASGPRRPRRGVVPKPMLEVAGRDNHRLSRAAPAVSSRLETRNEDFP
jgi:hypothetical protein